MVNSAGDRGAARSRCGSLRPTPELHERAAKRATARTLTPAIRGRPPWSYPAARSFGAVKGVFHAPESSAALKPETRDAVPWRSQRTRAWFDDLIEHRVVSFAEIAAREAKAERHIRLLAPLAFVSPRSSRRRRNRTRRSHRDRPRQGAALLVGRAGAAHRTTAIGARGGLRNDAAVPILTKRGNSGRSGALCMHGPSPNGRCASLFSVEQ